MSPSLPGLVLRMNSESQHRLEVPGEWGKSICKTQGPPKPSQPTVALTCSRPFLAPSLMGMFPKEGEELEGSPFPPSLLPS